MNPQLDPKPSAPPASRRERRALERASRRWLAEVNRTDLPENVRLLAPVIAATAVETGNSFTIDDIAATLGRLGQVN